MIIVVTMKTSKEENMTMIEVGKVDLDPSIEWKVKELAEALHEVINVLKKNYHITGNTPNSVTYNELERIGRRIQRL